MSIVDAELIAYNAANMPQDDVSTTGGAVAVTGRPELTQWSGNAVAAFLSDGADVRTATVRGRKPNGVITSEVVTLSGAVEALGLITFERILSVVLSATSGTRTVSMKQGSGGTVRATIGPTETTRQIHFQDATSETGIATRTEKFFWKNTNGASLALTNATVTLTADPLSRITMALAAAKDDSGSIANRKASTGLVFVDDNVAQGVPSGSLDAGEAIGTWVKLTLPANDPANRTTFTTELAGQTT